MIPSVSLYWISIICINSISLFVLLVLLLKNKTNRVAHFLGSIAFIVCILLIINNFMYTQGILLDHPHLYQVITPAE